MNLPQKITVIFLVLGLVIVLGLGFYARFSTPEINPELNCTPSSVIVPVWFTALFYFGLVSLIVSCCIGLIIFNNKTQSNNTDETKHDTP